MRHAVTKYVEKLRYKYPYGFSPHTMIVILAIAIGVMSAGMVIIFRFILEHVKELIFIGGQELLHIEKINWQEFSWHDFKSRLLLPLLPMFGAVLLIPLAKLFPGEVYGYKFPFFIEKVNLRGAIVSFKTIFLRIIAPALSLGSGGSVGVEGPVAIIGAGVGSLTGQFFGSSAQQRTLLIAAGAAGTIAATFKAPIAGVMFSTEILLLGNFEMISFIAIVISAAIAAAISNAYYGSAPAFTMPITEIKSIYETPLYILLGLYLGVISVLFTKIFYWTKWKFEAIQISEYIKPIIGAFIVGVIGVFYPHVMTDGYDHIVEALKGNFVFSLMFALIFIKIIATSLSLGSGGAGGVFAPSLFIGAMAGGAFGAAVNYIFPEQITYLYISQPGTYAAIGMGGFLAAATHAPLTGIFLMLELTGNYKVLIPVMLASVTGVFMATRIFKDSIDTVELTKKGVDLHEGKELTILKSLKVIDIMTKTFTSIDKDETLNHVIDLIIKGHGMYFPVVNSKMELYGIISINDIKSVVLDDKIKQVVTAGQLSTEDVVVINSTDNLNEALEKLSMMDLDEMPVVDVFAHKKVLGMIRKSDILSTYNYELRARQAESH
ncbi:MAG: chloride channel protein [Nitrospirae bacterium]|nr:chloride channel protein [Nitrospirota bacterium]